MKIHTRPPLPPLLPPPPPKPPPTAFQLAMQAEELTKAAQQQKDRLKKLFGGRKRPEDTDDNTDSDMHGRDRRSKRNLDFLA